MLVWTVVDAKKSNTGGYELVDPGYNEVAVTLDLKTRRPDAAKSALSHTSTALPLVRNRELNPQLIRPPPDNEDELENTDTD